MAEAAQPAPSRGMAAVLEILDSRDHFSVLQLPLPTVDVLEKPVWDVTPEEVLKAHRKLARWCHPDKRALMTVSRARVVVDGLFGVTRNPMQLQDEEAEDAERAYKKLDEAKLELSNEDTRGPYVRQYISDFGLSKKKVEAVQNDDFLASAKKITEEEEARKKAVQEARAAQGKEMGNSVAQEMEKRRKLAELKRLEKAKASREADSSDSDDEIAQRNRLKAPMVAKRKGDDDDDDSGANKRKRNAMRGRGGKRVGCL
mmetsp:Transcript_45300/g.71030  ORF Transcript_45300/g.71030 Transcript_45300/m.71030 type:complete len:258 (-) Transcript_45300:1220-1993(-)